MSSKFTRVESELHRPGQQRIRLRQRNETLTKIAGSESLASLTKPTGRSTVIRDRDDRSHVPGVGPSGAKRGGQAMSTADRDDTRPEFLADYMEMWLMFNRLTHSTTSYFSTSRWRTLGS